MSANARIPLRRFLLMVCLLAVVAAGADARPALSGRSVDISLSTPLTVLAAIAWIVGALLIVFALLRSISWRRRRGPDDQHRVVELPVSRFARALAVAACFALLVIPAVLLVTAAHHPGARGMPSSSIASTASQPRHAPAARSTAHAPSMIELVGLAVAAVAAAGAATAIRRRQHADMSPGQSDEPETGSADAVSAIIRRGGEAMTGIRDARAAIIACYAAMESVLADTGLPRDRAQTPSELLHAAVRDGIVAAEPAVRLTRLFEQARFGDGPMTDIDRRTAEHALTRLDPRRQPDRPRT